MEIEELTVVEKSRIPGHKAGMTNTILRFDDLAWIQII